MNINSITITTSDGKIFSAPGSLFTEIQAPILDPVVEIDTKTESGVEETFVPGTPEVAPVTE